MQVFPVENISRGEEGSGHLHSARLGLRHTVSRADFQQGGGRQLRVKCVARIYDVYYKDVQLSVGRGRRRRKVVKLSSETDNSKYTYLVNTEQPDQTGEQTAGASLFGYSGAGTPIADPYAAQLALLLYSYFLRPI